MEYLIQRSKALLMILSEQEAYQVLVDANVVPEEAFLAITGAQFLLRDELQSKENSNDTRIR